MVTAGSQYQFRPISLVETVYKILAKALALRLRKVVGKVVSPDRHAFIQGPQIFGATLIPDECIGFYVKSNQSNILYKLNIEKA